MYNEGLVKKFPVDRPLDDDERRSQLHQDKRIDADPGYQAAVIKINSTFVESVDKYYSWKGFLTCWTGVAFLISFGLWAAISYALFWGPADYSMHAAILNMVFLTILCFAMCAFLLRIILRECFRYTHYPIRFNRKNRMVYVHRFDGSVLKAPWDDLFFCIQCCRGSATVRDIRCHVLDEDGETVRETFALSMNDTSRDHLSRHWEFFRRYMEEGAPAAMAPLDIKCNGIDKHRETVGFGLQELLVNWNGSPFLQLLFMPFFLFALLGRIIAMRTSKIPQWPQWVQDACAIEPGDPCERNGRTHPLVLYKLRWQPAGKAASR